MELDEEQQDQARELASWWVDKAEDEVRLVVKKAVMYGGSDLEIMGAAMVQMISDAVKAGKSAEELRVRGLEMALAFYALGKVARLFGALERMEAPAEDTWFDLGVYARMGQHVREKGAWIKA